MRCGGLVVRCGGLVVRCGGLVVRCSGLVVRCGGLVVRCGGLEVRCGGLVVSVPATRSARPGFESRPVASPQSGLRGGRSLCQYCINKL